MRYYIQPAARPAGITKKIGWHTFRHTFSTLIKSLGVDAKVVQELLRHASFKTTMDGYTQVPGAAGPGKHNHQKDRFRKQSLPWT